MKIFTVHEPHDLSGDPAADADRLEFVRDGFHFWAFLLGPLWMLWRRMWLVLVAYVLLMAVVQILLWRAGVPGFGRTGVGLLIALLVGFEAPTLRRFSLRKWRQAGVVVGRDQEDAERRFFDAWARGDSLPPMRPIPPAPTAAPAEARGVPVRSPQPPSDIIGLFPEPEPRARG